MTKEDRIQLIEEARILGMKTVTIDGVVYEFEKEVLKPNKPELSSKEIEDLMKALNPLSEYTDQELLYYSTPFFDELQLRKEHQKKLKEESTNG